MGEAPSDRERVPWYNAPVDFWRSEAAPLKTLHQSLPATGPAREALRESGQFWTPAWVAEAMVRYVLGDGCCRLFDPAVGAGAFLSAAKSLSFERGQRIQLLGAETDPEALQQARAAGLTAEELRGVELRDFVLDPPSGLFSAIVANPPYIRHHRLSPDMKTSLKALAARLIGVPLDGRAGLHVFFLLRALERLATGGRLAFIMPADTCEGVYAPTLWNWITQHYRLDAVVTFEPKASPFPRVDTNAVIFLISNQPPRESFHWARCLAPWSGDLTAWLASEFTASPGATLVVSIRTLSEGLTTGLSRAPRTEQPAGPTLDEFATVMRGIATGANDFFFLTREQAADLQIPEEFLRPAIGRTRDVAEEVITEEALQQLSADGRPTLLLSLDGRPVEDLPEAVQRYLQPGEKAGLPTRALIAQRKPWYRMEVRRVPPFLFAYLGRRNARFIRNDAGVLPLTGFLCVYPRSDDPDFVERLWQVLRHPDTVANLSVVGKSYGSGAIKVEPRALERLPLPESVVRAAGLQAPPSLTLF